MSFFVPLGGLLTRAGTFVADKAGWLEMLKQKAGRSQGAIAGAVGGINQANIFEQYTNVLLAMAEHQPLLLILDDLHWADRASIGLLFRLGGAFPPAGSRSSAPTAQTKFPSAKVTTGIPWRRCWRNSNATMAISPSI